MTKKFSRLAADATQLNIAADALLTIASGEDFAIGGLLVMNGSVSGTTTQQGLFFTGAYQETGGIVAHWFAHDSTNANAGKIAYNINGGTTSQCVVPLTLEAGKSYIWGLQRSGGVLNGKVVEVTTTQPTDGSKVVSSPNQANTSAFTMPAGYSVGYGTATGRRLDQSAGRFFVSPRALSDFEWAQMAWGKEITAFVAPKIYSRLNDLNDFANTGTLAVAITASGTITPGADAPFGFSSVPTAPSFPKKPIFVGAAVVGQALGYTEGAAVGNPSPNVTHQWYLSTTATGTKTAISGATGATYTPVAGDVGKYLHLIITADNDIEPNATTTGDPVLVSSTAVSLNMLVLREAVWVPSIAPEQIFQREAGGVNGRAALPIGGQFEGATPAKVEMQIYNFDGTIVIRPWFNVGATFDATAKTWAANPVVDAPTDQLKYRAMLRSVDGGGITMVTTPLTGRFGVGDRIVVIGSSSPAGWFGSGGGSNRSPDHNKLSTYNNTDRQWLLFDSYGQASLMAQAIANHTKVPTAIIGLAMGGTSLFDWARDSGNGALWPRIQSLLNNIGKKMAGLIGSAGSNDVTSSAAALTVQSHLDKLNAVRDMFRRDTEMPTAPILWSGINRRHDALVLQANNAREAERAFGDQENIHYVQTLDIEVKDPNDPVDPGDGVHPTGAGYNTCCRRIEYVWVEGVVYGRKQRGSVITGITYAGARATMTLLHRNTGATDMIGMIRANSYTSPTTPAAPTAVSAATGFKVTDDDGAGGRIQIPILSIERADSSHLSLVCDRVLINPSVTYLEGAWVDNAVAVFDNAPTGLPMMAEPLGLASAAEPDLIGPTWSAGSFAAANVTASSATLSWPVANDAVGINRYEYSINGGNSYIQVAASVRSVNLTNLTQSTTYPSRVRAFDDAGNSSPELTVSFTTQANGSNDPPPPANTTRSVSLILGNGDGAVKNLTGLMVSFHPATGPHATGAAVYQSSTETTDDTGLITFTFSSSTVAAGSTGLLSVLTADKRHFLGTVVVQ